MNKLIAEKRKFSVLPPLFSWPVFLIYCLGALVMLGVGIAGATTDVSVYDLVNDPSLPYSGVLTKLGILLWCSTAAICFFCSALLKRIAKRLDAQKFIFFSAVLTSILMFDDLFLLHEHDGILVKYLGLGRFGFSEKVVFLGYAVIMLFGILKFRKMLFLKGNLLFYVALLFFGMSIAVDTVFSPLVKSLLGFGGYSWVEEGLKWMGIVSWFVYYSRLCFKQVINCRQGIFPA